MEASLSANAVTWPAALASSSCVPSLAGDGSDCIDPVLDLAAALAAATAARTSQSLGSLGSGLRPSGSTNTPTAGATDAGGCSAGVGTVGSANSAGGEGGAGSGGAACAAGAVNGGAIGGAAGVAGLLTAVK